MKSVIKVIIYERVNKQQKLSLYHFELNGPYREIWWQIIPNIQETIIDEETFNIVCRMCQGRRRNTATGRTSLFSGLTFCGDCGAKMYYCAAKSIKENQDFFRCSAYKENRGTCSIHFRAAGIITVPDEKEIVAAMEEIRNNPSNVA